MGLLWVKTIVKSLVGTIFLIIIISIIIEIYNINIIGMQINQLSLLSARQACNLFIQESYKPRGGEVDSSVTEDDGVAGGASSMYKIVDRNGDEYVSGDFYGENTCYGIYNKIFTSSDFNNWLNSSEIKKGSWFVLDLIKLGLTIDDLDNYDMNDPNFPKYSLAKSLVDDMVTPANMGITYLNKEIVENIFKWNLSAILSECNPEMIYEDENGEVCIHYKGFNVYANQAKISNIIYKVYDLSKDNDRDEFKKYTGIDASRLSFKVDSNLNSTLKKIGINVSDEERYKVCVAGVSIDVPVKYTGITPLKKVFEAAWEFEVKGLNNAGYINKTHNKFISNKENLKIGGFEGNKLPPGVVPLTNRLTFYVVR
ncbi:MAG: hypothetical protein QXD03_03975 [Candidatus Anstonellales archaeon]